MDLDELSDCEDDSEEEKADHSSWTATVQTGRLVKPTVSSSQTETVHDRPLTRRFYAAAQRLVQLNRAQQRLNGCSPQDLIDLLADGLVHSYSNLRSVIEQASEDFIVEFLRLGGIGMLLESLHALSGDAGSHALKTFQEALTAVHLGACIKAVLNHQDGMDFLVDGPAENLQGVILALNSNDILSKKQIWELLSTICLYDDHGRISVLKTLAHYHRLKTRYRFSIVIQELRLADAPVVYHQVR